nr:potassium channel subfamily K member 18-like [Lytechinus pictus]
MTTIRNVSRDQANFSSGGQQLDDLTIDTISGFADKILDRCHPEKRNYKWDMAGGVHFCLTVMSTIGYGLIVPRTQLGRAVCIIYAMMGIPINIIFMAGIGRVLARLIDRTYCLYLRAFRLCPCSKPKPKHERQKKENCAGKTRQRRPSMRSNQVSGEGAALPDSGHAKHTQKCDMIQEAYDRVTRSSVFHVMYSDWSKKQPETSFTGPSLPEVHVSGEIGLSGEAKSCQDADKTSRSESVEDMDMDEEKSGRPLAPVWFIILFVSVCATIFDIIIWNSDVLEDNWTLIDLMYFKFITYSTIGFGDLYINPPKKALHGLSVCVDIVTIVLGMSFLSMVINIIASTDRLNQSLNFVTCLLHTMWQYISNVLCRRDRT